MAGVVCPICEMAFETSQAPGQPAKCPGCGQVLEVPGPSLPARIMSSARVGFAKWRAERKALKSERERRQAEERSRREAQAAAQQQALGPVRASSPASPPVVEVQIADRPTKASGGGFSKGFSVTCGVIAAIFFTLCLGFGGCLVLGGGCLDLLRRAGNEVEGDRAPVAFEEKGRTQARDIVPSTSSVAGPPPSPSRQARLEGAVAYLREVPQVRWMEIERNAVYIGFEPLPDDWRNIICAAAMHGNRAINFGCHVWAVPGSSPGWRPGDGPYYGEVTARYGKIQ